MYRARNTSRNTSYISASWCDWSSLGQSEDLRILMILSRSLPSMIMNVFVLLLLSLLTTAHGQNFCPFDANDLNSPCAASACQALPVSTTHNDSVANNCINHISNYCAHSSRTQELDPGKPQPNQCPVVVLFGNSGCPPS
jgi:hypothetical protein